MTLPEDERYLAPIQSGDRLLVVANPKTRRNITTIVTSLRRAAPDGVDIDVRLTNRAGEARELAERHSDGARMLIAVGGDGTVADVAVAAIERRIPLAILQGGSTNIIAKELRIPADASAGTALLVGEHRLKLMDVGVSEGRYFLHMAGAGFDSRLFARANPSLKQRVGWLAYLPAAAQALGDRPSSVRVDVDGQVVTAKSPLVLIANGRSLMHAAITIAPDISKSDGLLDVFVVENVGLFAKASVLGRFASGHLDRSPHVTRLRGRHVELEADPPLPMQYDGDVFGHTPAVFDLLDKALQVVVPKLPTAAASSPA